MKRLLALMVGFAILGGVGTTSVSATPYVEDFEAPFPAWESGWLGTNSDTANYYSNSSDRGNNPDGLWLGLDTITFNSGFGSTISSLSIDLANWTDIQLNAFDMSNNLLWSQTFTPNEGALTDPGTYWHFATVSANGISRLEFAGPSVPGNTSIDNVVVQTSGNSVPEPASLLFLGSSLVGLFGLVAWRWKRAA